MDTLDPHDFWSSRAEELGATLPVLLEPSVPENADVIAHPDEERVWNSEYFKDPPFRLRRCQIEGTKYWKDNRDGCLLEHATGSGKTLTGLMIASNMFESSDYVIIACPLKDIALQWEKEAKNHFNEEVRVDIVDSDHDVKLGGVASSIRRGIYSKSVLIYVNNSLINDKKWSDLIISRITKSYSIILDEAHKWCSDNKLDFLENHILDSKKNMLSLTAKLHKGDTGTPRIYATIEGSKPPHIFSLFDAIQEGSDDCNNRILKPYNYHIHLIKVDITKDQQYVRDKLLTDSINKTVGLISDKKGIPTIVYVKSATSDEKNGAPAVAGRIATEADVTCQDYIGNRTAAMKEQRRHLFNRGDLEVLVAVRCLDEGVNIPRIQRLMLTHGSLDDERQWIQRRGRALRIDDEFPENPEIHDFLPVPLDLNTEDIDVESVDLLKRHYKKVVELADLSQHSFGLKEYKEIMTEVKQW